MSLPTGVTTRTLTISTASAVNGQKSSLEVVIVPTVKTLVWAATAEPLVSYFPTIRTGPDQAAIVELPITDQTGWVDENQNPITDFAYLIKVRYLLDGRKVGQTVTKYFKPLTSSPTVVDFDAVPTGEAPLYQGPPGPAGKSAYQVAVDNGFQGTEAQWLASLATGGIAPFYRHNQATPASTWTIHHNLGFYPGGVMTVDSSGKEFKAEITHIDENTVQVVMSAQQSGSAFVS